MGSFQHQGPVIGEVYEKGKLADMHDIWHYFFTNLVVCVVYNPYRCIQPLQIVEFVHGCRHAVKLRHDIYGKFNH